MIAELGISRADWQAMRRYVDERAPVEACGLLAGRGSRIESVYPIPNILNRPDRFRMDPRGQLAAFHEIEADGLELLAIFHSHPAGPAHPSPTDIAEWAYPVAAVIWTPLDGKWQARGFWIESGRFSEVPLRILAGK